MVATSCGNFALHNGTRRGLNDFIKLCQTLSLSLSLPLSLSLFPPFVTGGRTVQNTAAWVNRGAKWPSWGKIGSNLRVIFIRRDFFRKAETRRELRETKETQEGREYIATFRLQMLSSANTVEWRHSKLQRRNSCACDNTSL